MTSRGAARYLSEWKSLPDGAFVATNKFYRKTTTFDNSSSPAAQYVINRFNYTNNLPFPTETNFLSAAAYLPYIAFNYLGQLVLNDSTPWPDQYEYIPIAQGTVLYATDSNKALTAGPADFTENPPGNSTNSMFSIVRIDRLTGRATQLTQKIP